MVYHECNRRYYTLYEVVVWIPAVDTAKLACRTCTVHNLTTLQDLSERQYATPHGCEASSERGSIPLYLPTSSPKVPDRPDDP